MTTPLATDDATLEQLADLVARRVIEQLATSSSERLVDAGEIARRYGITRSWAYEHADELGALRLGHGSRPRLRFSLEAVERYLATVSGQQPAVPLARPRRRRQHAATRHTTNGAPLLESRMPHDKH